MKSKPILKAISLLTAVLYFLTQHCAYAAELQALHSSRTSEVRLPEISSFFVPPEWGSVQELQGEQPQVVLIQDAHGRYEAQRNTAAILDFLHRKKGIAGLFLEGGAGTLDPDRLKLFNEPQWNHKAVELLAREAEAGGAEIFLISQKDKKIPSFGLEDSQLYRQDLKAFRKVLSARGETGKYLEAELSAIRQQSGRIQRADLKVFFKEWMSYESSQDLLRFLSPLERESRQRLEIDLYSPRYQMEWPQLIRFFELKKREPQMQADQAREELKALREWSRRAGLAGPLIDFLGKNEKERLEFLRRPDSPFASLRHFWEAFYEAAHPRGFGFEHFPALTLYEGALILQREMDSQKLFEEINRLAGRILDTLARSAEEKELLERTRRYFLIKKLFQLQLTRREFRELEKKYRRGIPQAPSLIKTARLFYFLACKREEAMSREFQKHAQDSSSGFSVLIAGGFHTEFLTTALKKRGISYAVVSPHLSETGSDEKYVAAMLGEKPRLDFSSVESSTLMQSTAMGDMPLPQDILSRRLKIRSEIRSWGHAHGATLFDRPSRAGRSLLAPALRANHADLHSEVRSEVLKQENQEIAIRSVGGHALLDDLINWDIVVRMSLHLMLQNFLSGEILEETRPGVKKLEDAMDYFLKIWKETVAYKKAGKEGADKKETLEKILPLFKSYQAAVLETKQHFGQERITKILESGEDSKVLYERLMRTLPRLETILITQMEFIEGSLRLESVLLEDFFRGLKTRLEQKLPQLSIVFRPLDPPDFSFPLQPHLLGRMAGELAKNALAEAKKNNVEKPFFEMTADVKEDRVIFRFEDNAGGIAPDFLEDGKVPGRPKIFDLETSSKGGGVGLAEAWHVVSLHKGTIHIVSEPGKGTTFEIQIPRSEARAGEFTLNKPELYRERLRRHNPLEILEEEKKKLRQDLASFLLNYTLQISNAPKYFNMQKMSPQTRAEFQRQLADLKKSAVLLQSIVDHFNKGDFWRAFMKWTEFLAQVKPLGFIEDGMKIPAEDLAQWTMRLKRFALGAPFGEERRKKAVDSAYNDFEEAFLNQMTATKDHEIRGKTLRSLLQLSQLVLKWYLARLKNPSSGLHELYLFPEESKPFDQLFPPEDPNFYYRILDRFGLYEDVLLAELYRRTTKLLESASGISPKSEVRLRKHPVKVRPDQSYRIETVQDVLDPKNRVLEKEVAGRKVFFLVDEGVGAEVLQKVRQYLQSLGLGPENQMLIPKGADKAKRGEALVDEIHQRADALELSRKDIFVLIGRKEALNMAGFAAARFHRGIPYLKIPAGDIPDLDAVLSPETGLTKFGQEKFDGTVFPPQAILLDTSLIKTQTKIKETKRRVKFQPNLDYPVMMSRGIFDPGNHFLQKMIGKRKFLMIVDRNIGAESLQAIRNSLGISEKQLLVLPGGEGVKNEENGKANIERIHRRAYRLGMTSNDVFGFVGGGAVSDLRIAAERYDLGTPYLLIPSTFEGQIDAVIGVKGAINKFGQKNFDGLFSTPEAVLVDTALLKTLPDREIRAGMSEAVKVALMKDLSYFQLIEKGWREVTDKNFVPGGIAEEIMWGSIVNHLEQIETDPFETKLARPLDYGHEWGHRWEKVIGPSVRHGEGVWFGSAIDTVISWKRGFITAAERDRILNLMDQIGWRNEEIGAIPTYDPRATVEDLWPGLESFRRHLGGKLTISLLGGIGVKRDVHDIKKSELKFALDFLRKRAARLRSELREQPTIQDFLKVFWERSKNQIYKPYAQIQEAVNQKIESGEFFSPAYPADQAQLIGKIFEEYFKTYPPEGAPYRFQSSGEDMLFSDYMPGYGLSIVPDLKGETQTGFYLHFITPATDPEGAFAAPSMAETLELFTLFSKSSRVVLQYDSRWGKFAILSIGLLLVAVPIFILMWMDLQAGGFVPIGFAEAAPYLFVSALGSPLVIFGFWAMDKLKRNPSYAFSFLTAGGEIRRRINSMTWKYQINKSRSEMRAELINAGTDKESRERLRRHNPPQILQEWKKRTAEDLKHFQGLFLFDPEVTSAWKVQGLNKHLEQLKEILEKVAGSFQNENFQQAFLIWNTFQHEGSRILYRILEDAPEEWLHLSTILKRFALGAPLDEELRRRAVDLAFDDFEKAFLDQMVAVGKNLEFRRQTMARLVALSRRLLAFYRDYPLAYSSGIVLPPQEIWPLDALFYPENSTLFRRIFDRYGLYENDLYLEFYIRTTRLLENAFQGFSTIEPLLPAPAKKEEVKPSEVLKPEKTTGEVVFPGSLIGVDVALGVAFFLSGVLLEFLGQSPFGAAFMFFSGGFNLMLSILLLGRLGKQNPGFKFSQIYSNPSLGVKILFWPYFFWGFFIALATSTVFVDFFPAAFPANGDIHPVYTNLMGALLGMMAVSSKFSVLLLRERLSSGPSSSRSEVRAASQPAAAGLVPRQPDWTPYDSPYWWDNPIFEKDLGKYLSAVKEREQGIYHLENASIVERKLLYELLGRRFMPRNPVQSSVTIRISWKKDVEEFGKKLEELLDDQGHFKPEVLQEVQHTILTQRDRANGFSYANQWLGFLGPDKKPTTEENIRRWLTEAAPRVEKILAYEIEKQQINLKIKIGSPRSEMRTEKGSQDFGGIFGEKSDAAANPILFKRSFDREWLKEIQIQIRSTLLARPFSEFLKALDSGELKGVFAANLPGAAGVMEFNGKPYVLLPSFLKENPKGVKPYIWQIMAGFLIVQAAALATGEDFLKQSEELRKIMMGHWWADDPDRRHFFKFAEKIDAAVGGGRLTSFLKEVPPPAFKPAGPLKSLTPPRTKKIQAKKALTNWKEAFILPVSSKALGIGFQPQGEIFWTEEEGSIFKLWDMKTLKVFKTFERGTADAVESMAFFPDGQNILTFSPKGKAGIWNLKTKTYLPGIKWRMDLNLRNIAISPDGQRVLLNDFYGSMEMRELRSGNRISFDVVNLPGRVDGAFFSTDGKKVIIVSHFSDSFDRDFITIVDSTTAKTLDSISVDDSVEESFLSSDGKKMLTFSTESSRQTLRLWDAESGRLLRSKYFSSYFFYIAFSNPAEQILIYRTNGTAMLWDLKTWKAVAAFDSARKRKTSYDSGAISPDGKTIILGDREGNLEFWEKQTARSEVRQTPQRVGVISGTFNIFHNAHLALGEAALQSDTLRLDEVVYVPARVSPDRLDEESVPADIRHALVLKGTEDNPRMKVSDLDLKREKPSYTVDLLEDLRKEYPPGTEFFYIMGGDRRKDLPKYKDVEKIVSMAKIAVVARPGISWPEDGIETVLLQAAESNISATDILKNIREGKSIRGMAPEKVAQAVAEHPFFRSRSEVRQGLRMPAVADLLESARSEVRTDGHRGGEAITRKNTPDVLKENWWIKDPKGRVGIIKQLTGSFKGKKADGHIRVAFLKENGFQHDENWGAFFILDIPEKDERQQFHLATLQEIAAYREIQRSTAREYGELKETQAAAKEERVAGLSKEIAEWTPYDSPYWWNSEVFRTDLEKYRQGLANRQQGIYSLENASIVERKLLYELIGRRFITTSPAQAADSIRSLLKKHPQELEAKLKEVLDKKGGLAPAAVEKAYESIMEQRERYGEKSYAYKWLNFRGRENKITTKEDILRWLKEAAPRVEKILAYEIKKQKIKLKIKIGSARSEARSDETAAEQEEHTYHLRAISAVEYYPQDFMLYAAPAAENLDMPDMTVSRYRPRDMERPRIVQESREDYVRHLLRVKKLEDARQDLLKLARKLGDAEMEGRAERIGRSTTVIGVHTPSYLLFHDLEKNKMGVYHISRSRSAIYFSIPFLNKIRSIRELALYLDRAQRWIDGYEKLEHELFEHKLTAEEFLERMKGIRAGFKIQDETLLGRGDRPKGKEKIIQFISRLRKLAERDEKNKSRRLLEYRAIAGTIKSQEAVLKGLKDKGPLEIRLEPTHLLNELAKNYGYLAHLQDILETHEVARKTYRRQVEVMRETQAAADQGMFVLTLQEKILRTDFRAGYYEDGLADLKVYLTGWGFPTGPARSPMGLWSNERNFLGVMVSTSHGNSLESELLSLLWERQELSSIDDYQKTEAIAEKIRQLFAQARKEVQEGGEWWQESAKFPEWTMEDRSEMRSGEGKLWWKSPEDAGWYVFIYQGEEYQVDPQGTFYDKQKKAVVPQYQQEMREDPALQAILERIGFVTGSEESVLMRPVPERVLTREEITGVQSVSHFEEHPSENPWQEVLRSRQQFKKAFAIPAEYETVKNVSVVYEPMLGWPSIHVEPGIYGPSHARHGRLIEESAGPEVFKLFEIYLEGILGSHESNLEHEFLQNPVEFTAGKNIWRAKEDTLEDIHKARRFISEEAREFFLSDDGKQMREYADSDLFEDFKMELIQALYEGWSGPGKTLAQYFETIYRLHQMPARDEALKLLKILRTTRPFFDILSGRYREYEAPEMRFDKDAYLLSHLIPDEKQLVISPARTLETFHAKVKKAKDSNRIFLFKRGLDIPNSMREEMGASAQNHGMAVLMGYQGKVYLIRRSVSHSHLAAPDQAGHWERLEAGLVKSSGRPYWFLKPLNESANSLHPVFVRRIFEKIRNEKIRLQRDPGFKVFDEWIISLGLAVNLKGQFLKHSGAALVKGSGGEFEPADPLREVFKKRYQFHPWFKDPQPEKSVKVFRGFVNLGGAVLVLEQKGDAAAVITEKGAAYSFVEGEKKKIGRVPQVDIRLNSANISRLHAQIKWENGEFSVLDFSSTNGTYVAGAYGNGKPGDWGTRISGPEWSKVPVFEIQPRSEARSLKVKTFLNSKQQSLNDVMELFKEKFKQANRDDAQTRKIFAQAEIYQAPAPWPIRTRQGLDFAVEVGEMSRWELAQTWLSLWGERDLRTEPDPLLKLLDQMTEDWINFNHYLGHVPARYIFVLSMAEFMSADLDEQKEFASRVFDAEKGEIAFAEIMRRWTKLSVESSGEILAKLEKQGAFKDLPANTGELVSRLSGPEALGPMEELSRSEVRKMKPLLWATAIISGSVLGFIVWWYFGWYFQPQQPPGPVVPPAVKKNPLEGKTVNELIAISKDDERPAQERQEALKAIGATEDPLVIAAIVNALQDQEIRPGAEKALLKIGEPAVKALILSLKNDEKPGMRGSSAFSLGQVLSRITVKKEIEDLAVQALIEGLRDQDWDVRGKSAGALGDMQTPEAIEPLVKVLSESLKNALKAAKNKEPGINDRELTVRAIYALTQIDIPAPPALRILEQIQREHPQMRIRDEAKRGLDFLNRNKKMIVLRSEVRSDDRKETGLWAGELRKHSPDKALELGGLIESGSVSLEDRNQVVQTPAGQKLVEHSPFGTTRFFDLNGRWILTLDPYRNKIDELRWDKNGKFVAAWTLNGDRAPLQLEAGEDGLVKEVESAENGHRIFKFFPGINFNKIEKVPYAEFEDNLSYDSPVPSQGVGNSVFRIVAYLAKDQKTKLVYSGDSRKDIFPTDRLFNSLLEVAHFPAEYSKLEMTAMDLLTLSRGAYATDLLDLSEERQRFRIDPVTVSWSPDPPERAFHPRNEIFVSVRNGRIERAFYDTNFYVGKEFIFGFRPTKKTIQPDDHENFRILYGDKVLLTLDLKGNIVSGSPESPRSEVRRVASGLRPQDDTSVLEVSVKVTNKILASDLPGLQKFYALLFPEAFAPKELINRKDREKLVSAYIQLIPGGAAVVIPAELLLGLPEKARQEYLSLIYEGIQGSGGRPSAQIIFAGEGAAELKEKMSSYGLRMPRWHEAFKMISVDEMTAGERYKKNPVSVSLSHVPEDYPANRNIPALLLPAEKIKELPDEKRFQYLNKLTQLQLLAARAPELQGLRGEPLEIALIRFLRKLQIDVETTSGFISPSTPSLLAADMAQILASAKLISQAA